MSVEYELWKRKLKGNVSCVCVCTFFPHVHMVDLPVAIFGLTDATVGQRVTGVIRVHPEVQVMTRVSHGQLRRRRNTGMDGEKKTDNKKINSLSSLIMFHITQKVNPRQREEQEGTERRERGQNCQRKHMRKRKSKKNKE